MRLHKDAPSFVMFGAFCLIRWFRFHALAGLLLAGVIFVNGGCGTRGNLAGPLAINSFVATPASVTAGQSTVLSWSVSLAAVSVSISNGGSTPSSGLTAISGTSVSVTPAATTTYTLTAADGSGNSTTATVTVTVVAAPVISSFTASPITISNSGASTLTWAVANATAVSIECISNGCQFQNAPENTYVPVTGNSIAVNPGATTTYQIQATNAAAQTAVAQVTVNVVLAPVINTFTASPASIGMGQSATLSWSVSGASTISISGIGTVTGTSIQVNPAQTTTYTLTATATDSTGTFMVSSTAQTTVTVSTTPPPSITSFIATPPSVGPGGHVTLTPVFTPVDNSTTADLASCTGTEAQCSSATANFQDLGPVTSGEVFDAYPAASTTYRLTVTNTNPAPATALTRVIAGDVAVLAGFPTDRGYQDGSGQSARFNQPTGIAVDASGNIYVADTINNMIRMITPAGVVTTFAGDTANGPGLPGVPGSIDGPTQCNTAQPCAEFNQPEGVAVDSQGNVYVTDSGNNTIRVISGGMVTTIAGTAGTAGYQNGPGATALFYSPEGVAIDLHGNLIVADTSNCVIREISGISTSSVTVSTLAGPSGSGQCGYADGGINGSGVSLARFNFPTSVAMDANENVYVADQNNDVIRLIAPGGTVSTLAGLAGTPGSTDADGGAARFTQPSGVAVDALGNIYVADSGNYTIREISPSPSPAADGSGVNVTTIIGQAGNPDATIAGGSLPSLIASPDELAVDPSSGNLFITMNVHAIVKAPY
jgi:sugar lactone lactonase YvrE